MKWLSGILYYVAFCMVYGIADWSSFADRSEDLQNWTFGPTAVYWASRAAVILGWTTLLPAWLFAARVQSNLSRSAILFSGILFCLLPLWTGWFGSSGERATLHVLLAIIAAGVASIGLSYMPWRVGDVKS
jgi:hypothetical protein